MDADIIIAALSPVKDLLKPDGADVELVYASNGIVKLRLLMESVECKDVCVMPRRFLESISLQMMQPQIPGLTSVEIDDPRDVQPK